MKRVAEPLSDWVTVIVLNSGEAWDGYRVAQVQHVFGHNAVLDGFPSGSTLAVRGFRSHDVIAQTLHTREFATSHAPACKLAERLAELGMACSQEHVQPLER